MWPGPFRERSWRGQFAPGRDHAVDAADGTGAGGMDVGEGGGDSLPVLAALVAMTAGSGAAPLPLPRAEGGVRRKKAGWLGQLIEGFRFFRLSPLFLWTGLLMTRSTSAPGRFFR